MTYYTIPTDSLTPEIVDKYGSFFQHPDLVLCFDEDNQDVFNSISAKFALVEVVRSDESDPQPMFYAQHNSPASLVKVTTPVYLKTVNKYPNTFKLKSGYNDYYTNSDYSYHSGLSFNPDLVPDSDGNVWKPITSITKTFTKDYLKEQIRARYGFFNRPTNGLSNVVLDSFIPGLLYKYDMNESKLLENETFPKSSVCISPLLASMLNIKQVPTDELIKILGYTTKDITNLMKQVKAKDLHFVFAGVGGTGMNGAYWLDELSKLTNVINMFKTITVFEKENIEFSNILRFPIPLSSYYKSGHSAAKLNLVMPFLSRLTSRKINTYEKYLSRDGNYYSLPSEIFHQNWNSNTRKYDLTSRANTVIYGAPGIEYRNELSKIGNFVCATHASNSCSIWLNPTQTESIEIESYGMIQLGPFFMNQLRMVIGLLELLASDTPLDTPDHEYLDYEFDGISQMRTSRQYNFQIVRQLTMMTEDQANAI